MQVTCLCRCILTVDGSLFRKELEGRSIPIIRRIRLLIGGSFKGTVCKS
jgi:hypothetical protein